MEVLKQTSPETDAEAPNACPSKMVPSSSARMALGPKPNIAAESTDTPPNRQDVLTTKDTKDTKDTKGIEKLFSLFVSFVLFVVNDNLANRNGVTAKRRSLTLRGVKTVSPLAKLIIAGSLFAPSAFAQLKQHPVPSGKVTQAKFADSTVYPGTDRDYWIYVPAQYKPAQAASLMAVSYTHLTLPTICSV